MRQKPPSSLQILFDCAGYSIVLSGRRKSAQEYWDNSFVVEYQFTSAG
jgi:hypothetical protein